MADAPAPLLPPSRTWEEYSSVVGRAETWRPAIDEICRREGIAPGDDPRLVRSYVHPTFVVPPSHVIKIYVHWGSGHSLFEAEIRALQMMARDPDLPVPQLIGFGLLTDDYPYVVMSRIPGVPLRDVREALDDRAMAAIGSWSYRFFERLHALRLSDAEQEAGHETFVEHVRWLRGSVVERLSSRSLLPLHLVAQLDEWLPPIEELTGRVDETVVVHGDLHYNHIYLESTHRGYRPTGVIDVNRSRPGHPMFELPALWQDLRWERPSVIDAFLAGFGSRVTGGRDMADYGLAWALLQLVQRAYAIPTIADVTTLDELARLTFGPVERIDVAVP